MGKQTLKRIDEIVSRINVHPEYSRVVASSYLNNLLYEAERHSTSIELQAEGVNIGRHGHEAYRKESLVNLADARKYLSKEGISVGTLAALGNLVDPENHPYKNFRRAVEGASYRVGDVDLPSSRQVPILVENLSAFLNEDVSIHPVTRAISAHVAMVGIHPYEDGNGRAARLLQNFCLEQRYYPPAVIPASDRDIYIRLMNGALKSWLTHKIPAGDLLNGEGAFHDFVEGKVLAAAEGLETELKKNRVYDIELTKIKDKGVPFSVKKKLDSLQRRGEDRGIQVRLPDHRSTKSAKLEVRGDIGTEEIDLVLKRAETEYGLKYTLKSRKGCLS